METAVPLLSGAFAGLAVDLSLFPIDTVKTRLQAPGGLVANGGFRGVYAGMGSIAAGSAPGAALFFLSYETALSALRPRGARPGDKHGVATTIAASSVAECLACLIRVPTEVVKQRTQASRPRPSSATASVALSGSPSAAAAAASAESEERRSSYRTLRSILATGGVRGLYRGFSATLLREVPFVCLQFPLWEYLKALAVAERAGAVPRRLYINGTADDDDDDNDRWASDRRPENEMQATAAEAALCGAVAGSIAAAATTPLDVVKTRTMLHDGPPRSWLATAASVARNEGPSAFFRGIVPRVGWISVGGFIFLGGYSLARDTLSAAL